MAVLPAGGEVIIIIHDGTVFSISDTRAGVIVDDGCDGDAEVKFQPGNLVQKPVLVPSSSFWAQIHRNRGRCVPGTANRCKMSHAVET
jgi:hypothetical protein